MNVVLTLIDPGNRAVLFLPYYFNHLMALQLANAHVVYGPRDAGANFVPDLEWLESQMVEPATRPRLVVIVNPCNPTGTLGRRSSGGVGGVGCVRARVVCVLLRALACRSRDRQGSPGAGVRPL